MEGLIFKKPVIFLLVLGLLITGFFILVPLAKAESAPPAINYAPNLWFDSQEQYYPTNPLDFYFENGIEINGEIAVNKYNQLSLETKIKNMTVLYHILDYGNQWVYQYWLFYVLNDFPEIVKNEHYGDWEAVFVFVDKDSEQVVKAIGTAHQRKIFDIEIYYPQNNHIWTYVGNGSHANCIDENPDGYCDFIKWRGLEKWDRKGSRTMYDSYDLIEMSFDFIEVFSGMITLKESSKLGINPFDYLGIDKDFYIPWGGSPPTHAWAQSNYYNPEELEPISIKYVSEKVNQAANRVAGFFNNLVVGIADFFKGFGGSQEADISQTFMASEEYSSEPAPEPTFSVKEPEVSLPAAVEAEPEIKVVRGEPIAQKTPEIDSLPEITFSRGEPGAGLNEIEEESIDNKEPEGESEEELPADSTYFIGGSGSGGGGTTSPPDNSEDSNNDGDDAEESEHAEGSETEENESEEATTTPSLLPPKIISPNSGDIFGRADDYIASTPVVEVNLIGTSTPYSQILIFVSSTSTASTTNYLTTVDSQGDWQQVVVLEEGANTVRAKTKNNGEQSEETSLTLIVDIIPPAAIADLSAVASLQPGIINLSWTAPGDDGLIGTSTEYIIRYATSSGIIAASWDLAIDVANEPIPALAGTAENLSVSGLTAGQTYFWAIKSKDKAGNLSEISNSVSATSSAITQDLVISEIAVQRGSNRAKDEFIELYNPTDSPINLFGWSIQRASAMSTSTWYYKYFRVDDLTTSSLPNFDLASRKYYLLTSATSSDGYSYGIEPDLITVTTSGDPTHLGLADSGGKIRLLNNKGEIIDLVAWGKDSLGAEGGPVNIDSFSWGSLERKASATSTAELLAVNGVHYYLGNGWDTDDNSQDFVLQNQPNPQNSFSLAEPSDSFPVLADTAWPMLQHDAWHTGLSLYSGTATGTPTSTPKWMVDLGSSNPTSPVIDSDGLIYIGAGSGKLYRVEPTGSVEIFYNTQTNGVVQTPAIASDGTIYLTDDFALYSLSNGGRLKWEYPIHDGSPPTIGPAGNIYLGTDCFLSALNPNGQLIWQTQLGNSGNLKTPAIDPIKGVIYTVNRKFATLYALDINNGEIKWSRQTDDQNIAFNFSTAPSLTNQGVILVGGYASFGAPGLYAINPEEGTQKWNAHIGDISHSVAAISQNTVYIGTDNYSLYALDKASGDIKWSLNTKGKVYASPIIDADGTIYIGSESKNFYALNPDGFTKWQAELNGTVSSSAVIGPNGAVYIASDNGFLYAFGGLF